jgi:UDP-glucose 4-epimerase
MKVLVTGGCGYIGSHTCAALIQRGHEVVVVDNYSNSSPEALVRIRKLTAVMPTAYDVDVRDSRALGKILRRHGIDIGIHFAAKKSVPESTQVPLEYFDVNVTGTISLLRAMQQEGVRKLVFSSSCSVYGETNQQPLTESDRLAPTNPYSWTKWTCEQLIEQTCQFYPDFVATSLRYFNPIGADRSGLLGEAPTGPVFNVMPFLNQVAAGKLPELTVFGSDYPTPDGTAIRDYIHVVDAAHAHVAALDHIGDSPGMQVFNIGTGVGTSVMQLRRSFAEASGRYIPYVVRERRPGDVAVLIADARRVAHEWGWRTTYDLGDMCRDAWHFHCRNPHGYQNADSVLR